MCGIIIGAQLVDVWLSSYTEAYRPCTCSELGSMYFFSFKIRFLKMKVQLKANVEFLVNYTLMIAYVMFVLVS